MMDIATWQQILAEKNARIAELEELVKFYEGQFRLSKSRQFGASSEKGELPEQPLGLFCGVENTIAEHKPEPEFEQITYTRRKKRAGKRKDDLSALPVETIEHELPEAERFCPDCGSELHIMGHDCRRELKIIPAQVKVVEHNRAVYSCRDCEKNNDHVPIVKAPMPVPVLKGSLASPSAVAHIITQKYVMHAPLYRQEQDWKRQGVVLSRQTMANWVIRCAEDWLNPLYDRLRFLLLEHEILHADETRVQVLEEPGKSPTTNSFMWLYRTSGDTERHIVIFEYQPSRSHIHPQNFLKNFHGFLHADGYAAYHMLPGMIIIGCWVHMRRKFTDAIKTFPADQQADSIAQAAINKIGYLFHLESLWKNLEPEKRYELRLAKSKPLAEEFFAWLTTLNVLPKSATGKAIHYALEQQQWLMNVYLDGRSELSNNRILYLSKSYSEHPKKPYYCAVVA